MCSRSALTSNTRFLQLQSIGSELSEWEKATGHKGPDSLKSINLCPVFRKWVDDTTGARVTSTKFLGITTETKNSRCTRP